ncbi:Leucine-rich repeat-containing protein sog2 [Colletotrichum tanaceti]|uniref:Leucine-rich repeat-containing protein sog2 n=1 Tax=Colletotrichum tanaceti TaxID=1306861 RepID=A0A4U6X623_9PEZI|nr:Leucine-rich repeat-containing protein sog2 [Colletotrichum tanaceti]TKW50715.1 Leucine-rich repeat-containing protein sog2 [Colletotrichum tanaceti]
MSVQRVPPAAHGASSSMSGRQPRIIQLVIEAIRNAHRDGRRAAPNGQNTRRNHALAVDLSFQGMQTIPEAVIDLTNGDLERLMVSHNLLTSLPVRLCECANLRHLIARNNNIDVFPLPICHLRSLETLDLGYNKLRVIPEQIVHLSSLKVLSIPHNLVTRLPFCIGSMNSLRSLNIARNPLEFPPSKVLRPLDEKDATDGFVAEQVKRFLKQHQYSHHTYPVGETSLIDAANAIARCLPDLHTVLLTLGSATRQTITIKSPLEKIVDRAGICLREVQLFVQFAVEEDSDDARLGLPRACATLLEACSRTCSEIMNNTDMIVDKVGAHRVRVLLGLMHRTCMELRHVVMARHSVEPETLPESTPSARRPASRRPAAGGMRASSLPLNAGPLTAILTRDPGSLKAKAPAPSDGDVSFDALSHSLQEACGLVLATIPLLSDQVLASWSKDTARKPGSRPVRLWEALLTTCSSNRQRAMLLRTCLSSLSPRDLATRDQPLLVDSASRLISSWTQLGERLIALRDALRLSADVKRHLRIIQTTMKKCAHLLRLWTRKDPRASGLSIRKRESINA